MSWIPGSLRLCGHSQPWLAREDCKSGLFYPTSVMETGYDILFFWVARMIMAGLEFTGQAPFHRLFTRDDQG